MLVSVLIPARNEKYLEKTIHSVLDTAEGDVEVLIALDGYLPDPQIVTNDDRVRFFHNEESIGQRQSVNMLAREAKGDYLMKLDAHCIMDNGWDVKLIADYQEGEVHLPRMYNLDVYKWEPKFHKRTDYMYMGFNEQNQLRSQYYKGRAWKDWHRGRDDILIDETMGMMGPCRFMSTKTFWDLGGCDEGHGGWGSEGIEWSMKAWLSGGRVMVNKKTWFAHWFRGSDGGFPYPMRQSQIDAARQYAENLWLQDKWPKQKRPFKWLIDKFNPPGWEHYSFTTETMDKKSLNVFFYNHIHKKSNHPVYRGVPILKMPTDISLYHEVVWEKKPDLIIEIGTKFGGLSLFLQDQLDLIGNGGKVVTVDVKDIVKEKDPRITYLLGDSISSDIEQKLFELGAGKQVMMVLDGNHNSKQVKWELHKYKDLVSVGQYMVVEDCYRPDGEIYGPGIAKEWFLKSIKRYTQTNIDDKYIIGFNISGWLLRTK